MKQYRHRRSANPSNAFPTPMEPGELAVNTANRQIAAGDADAASVGAPLPMLAVRYFDPRASYLTDDIVVQAGNIYKAKAAVPPGAFNAANWTQAGGGGVSEAPINDLSYVRRNAAWALEATQVTIGMVPGTMLNSRGKGNALAGGVNYLPLTGGDLTGTLGLAGDPTSDMQAATKGYVDASGSNAAYGGAMNYLFNAGTVPPPAAGSVRFNNVNQVSTSIIHLNYTTNDTIAVNLKTFFKQRVRPGDTFYFQDKDDIAKWQLYRLTGLPTDNGNYATMSVAWVAGGNDLTAARIVVSREGAGAPSPVPEAPVDGYTYVRKDAAWVRETIGTLSTRVGMLPGTMVNGVSVTATMLAMQSEIAELKTRIAEIEGYQG